MFTTNFKIAKKRIYLVIQINSPMSLFPATLPFSAWLDTVMGLKC